MTKLAVLVAVATVALAARPSAARAGDGPRVPIRLEMRLGLQDPLGILGLALAYDRGGRVAAGLGVGLDDLKDDTLPPIGIFGRVRVLSWGWGSVGAGLALSRAVINDEGNFSASYVKWSWRPSYRATGTVGLELVSGAFSMRLDAGIGRILNAPTTASYVSTPYSTAYLPTRVVELPTAAAAHIADQRTVGSLTATVGYRFGRASASPAALPPGKKDPLTARRLSLWSTLGTLTASAATLTIAGLRDDVTLALAGGGLTVFGLAYGPGVGYLYADETLRGMGVGTLRLVGLVGGSLLFATGIPLSESAPDRSGRQLLGVAVVASCLVSAIYDIVKAPDAVRRTNQRWHGVDVAVVPTLIATADAQASGAALVGRF